MKFKASYGVPRCLQLLRRWRRNSPRCSPTACQRCHASRKHSIARHSFSLSRNHREACRLGPDSRGEIPFCRDPMHGAARGLLRELMTRQESTATKFAARMIRCSAASIPNRSSRTLKRCAAPSFQAATMPGCARTVTETVLARWTATARSSRRIRFSRSCSGTWPARAASPATLRKRFPRRKMIDKVAAKFGRNVFETPSASNISAS